MVSSHVHSGQGQAAAAASMGRCTPQPRQHRTMGHASRSFSTAAGRGSTGASHAAAAPQPARKRRRRAAADGRPAGLAVAGVAAREDLVGEHLIALLILRGGWGRGWCGGGGRGGVSAGAGCYQARGGLLGVKSAGRAKCTREDAARGCQKKAAAPMFIGQGCCEAAGLRREARASASARARAACLRRRRRIDQRRGSAAGASEPASPCRQAARCAPARRACCKRIASHCSRTPQTGVLYAPGGRQAAGLTTGWKGRSAKGTCFFAGCMLAKMRLQRRRPGAVGARRHEGMKTEPGFWVSGPPCAGSMHVPRSKRGLGKQCVANAAEQRDVLLRDSAATRDPLQHAQARAAGALTAP